MSPLPQFKRTIAGLITLLSFQSVSLVAALPEVSYLPFATGLTAPTAMLPYRSGDEAFLVLEQKGTISFLAEDGGQKGAVFLDLRDSMVKFKKKFDERGLLGLAFHPKFKKNRKIYDNSNLIRMGYKAY